MSSLMLDLGWSRRSLVASFRERPNSSAMVKLQVSKPHLLPNANGFTTPSRLSKPPHETVQLPGRTPSLRSNCH
jgi:hypothetical protein